MTRPTPGQPGLFPEPDPLEPFRRDWPAEEIGRLPLGRYGGPIEIISTPQELGQALGSLGRESVLGFDTETKPCFKKGQSNPPALVQLAGAGTVWLIRLNGGAGLGRLVDILADPRIVKAGVAVGDDVRDLQKIAPFSEAGFIDLGQIARQLNLKTHGLRNLAANFLGRRVSKQARVTNWAQSQLSPAQIAYAATDAWISRELYLAFRRLGLV